MDAYQVRRSEIARQARGPHTSAAVIDYLESEHRTWARAKAALDRAWADHAAPEIIEAADRLNLPVDRVPQLCEVTDRLTPRTGFHFRAVAGLVPVEQFFGSLADGVFLSTQYVRHHDSPHYTPEPDVIHEVIGHGTSLADPHLSVLHRQAGAAMSRLETPEARQAIADVFWFSAEFGVLVDKDGPLAYGAGLLSSVGEMAAFRGATVRPLDVVAMAQQPYDIATFQPVLFGAASLTQVLDVVGEFFATATDDRVAGLQIAA